MILLKLNGGITIKIIITGGFGFIGSNLVNYFMQENENEVIVIDNLSRKGAKINYKWLQYLFGNNKNFTFVKEDIRNFDGIKNLFKDVDKVFHTAGQVAVTTSIIDPITDFKINVEGTLNILESIRQTNTDASILFTSTNKVYGNLEIYDVVLRNNRWDFKDLRDGNSENTPVDFHSPYGCSKGAADAYMKDYYRIYGIKTVVFRMSCIYGQRQFGNEDQGWVAHFIISSILGKPLTIYGDGKQVRDILYVDDLVSAMELATKYIDKTKGNVYNIGGGPNNVISLLELIEIIENRLKRKIDLSFDEWRPGDQKVYYSNISKAKSHFKWNPKINKYEGISKLFDWVIKNKELIKNIFK
ncbi:MAG: GDP-mannose 4,6-dehydratase [Candidatus Helarchaeota archaeon]